MKHQQILDHLAARGHVQALDEELSRWVRRQMSLRQATGDRVIPPVLARWRCLLDDDEARPVTKNVVWVALATTLHKYGFQDPAVTAEAVAAVDALNDAVALSDAFARQADKIKEFLASPPLPLTRKPSDPRPLTFLRPGDVLSVELHGRFHAAYVRKLNGLNETAVIEFYAGTFGRLPTTDELTDREAARPAAGARFAVTGLTYLPDPANQIRALAAAHPTGPTGGDPVPGQGLYAVTDLFSLQRDLENLFG